MKGIKFELGTEIFIVNPEVGYGVIKAIHIDERGKNVYTVLLENGNSHSNVSEGCIAFAHFDSVEESHQVCNEYHAGFIVGPNDPIYIPLGSHPKSLMTIGLGNSIELQEPHANIYPTHLDEINHTGVTLSLIRNAYIPHLRMTKELNREEFKFVKKILKRDWVKIQDMWNRGDDIWSPAPIQFHTPMPEYNYDTITRRN